MTLLWFAQNWNRAVRTCFRTAGIWDIDGMDIRIEEIEAQPIADIRTETAQTGIRATTDRPLR